MALAWAVKNSVLTQYFKRPFLFLKNFLLPAGAISSSDSLKLAITIERFRSAGVLARSGLCDLQVCSTLSLCKREGKGWCRPSQLAGSAGGDARAPRNPVYFGAMISGTSQLLDTQKMLHSVGRRPCIFIREFRPQPLQTGLGKRTGRCP